LMLFFCAISVKTESSGLVVVHITIKSGSFAVLTRSIRCSSSVFSLILSNAFLGNLVDASLTGIKTAVLNA